MNFKSPGKQRYLYKDKTILIQSGPYSGPTEDKAIQERNPNSPRPQLKLAQINEVILNKMSPASSLKILFAFRTAVYSCVGCSLYSDTTQRQELLKQDLFPWHSSIPWPKWSPQSHLILQAVFSYFLPMARNPRLGQSVTFTSKLWKVINKRSNCCSI